MSPLRRISDALKGKALQENIDMEIKQVLEAYHRLTKKEIDAIYTLKTIVEEINKAGIDEIKEEVAKHAELWYTQRRPEALIKLAIYGTKQYGEVFEDEADAVAYLITTLAMLKRLSDALQMRTEVENAWQTLERISKKLQGTTTLNKDEVKSLTTAVETITRARRKVARLAKEYIEEVKEIRLALANADDEFARRIAQYLSIEPKAARKLTKSESEETSDLTRGERAVGVLLSLTESNWYANAVRRSLINKGRGLAGALSIAAATRVSPDTFRRAFSAKSETFAEPSIRAKILYWLLRLKLNEVKGAEKLIIEEGEEKGRSYIEIATEKTSCRAVCVKKRECGSALSAWVVEDPQLISRYAALEKEAEAVRRSIAAKIREIYGQMSHLIIDGVYSGSITTNFYVGVRENRIDITMNTADPAQAAYAGIEIGGGIKLKYVYLTDRGPRGNYRITTSLPVEMKRWLFDEGKAALNQLGGEAGYRFVTGKNVSGNKQEA